MNRELFKNLTRLWNHFPSKRKKQFVLILFLMVIIAFIEVVSLGSVFPFMSVLTNPERIFNIARLNPIFLNLGIDVAAKLILPITLVFAFFSILVGAARIFLLWVNNRFHIAAGADISLDVFRKTLYQPYSVHLARNSSEIVSAIVQKTNAIFGQIILPTLTIIGSVLVLTAILTTLILVSPLITLWTFLLIGFSYILIAMDARKRLMHNGKTMAIESTSVLKSLTEGLGGIRDVLLNNSQEVYCEVYRKSDYALRIASGHNQIIASSPRYSVEALATVIFAFFVYFVSIRSGGIANELPLLGGLALAAMRILPLLQQIYGAWANIKSGEEMLNDVLKLLDQELLHVATQKNIHRLRFEKEIRLDGIYFKYSEDLPYVIRNISLKIKKGSRIGLIGTTGGGKSTLLDLVMYLLKPSKGQIRVDKEIIDSANMKAWQLNVANVPQSIYLSDSSISENIAFGIPSNLIDMDKVINSAKQAQIYDFISGLRAGFDTLVGERGVRLSGGQRQRIGIARALYKEASVIVFDEATSSLDSETEQAVMESIDGLGKDLTIFIIAHRLSTIRNCDKIIELSHGKVKRVGKYSEFFAK